MLFNCFSYCNALNMVFEVFFLLKSFFINWKPQLIKKNYSIPL